MEKIQLNSKIFPLKCLFQGWFWTTFTEKRNFYIHRLPSMMIKTALYEFTLVDQIKRKFRILLYKMPVINVLFGQHFLRISVKILHWPRAGDQSYHLWKFQYLVSMTYQCIPAPKITNVGFSKNFALILSIFSLRMFHVAWTSFLPQYSRKISQRCKTKCRWGKLAFSEPDYLGR